MTVDAAEVSSLLPPGRRYRDVEIVAVEAFDDVDAQGDDAVRVVLTLANPSGDTWRSADVLEVEAMIRRGLVAGGEERPVIFRIRPESEPDAIDEGPVPHFGR